LYLDFFGLQEKPFSIAPNPDYLFLTEKHKEALAHLQYGIGDEGGFVLLTGEIGTGKTTICRCMLNQLSSDIDLAFIVNPKLSALEMLEAVCDDFGIGYQQGDSARNLVNALNDFLLEAYAKGRSAILVVDEAQNLQEEVLEQLRLLTNLETSEKKLLQLILIGQPELNEKLEQYSMRQLAQRITASFHLEPLNFEETVDYIEHRLYISGFRGELFSNAALKHIYKSSGGTPRLINMICDRAMLGAFTLGELKIEYPIALSASDEVLHLKGSKPAGIDVKNNEHRFMLYLLVAALLVFLVFAVRSIANWDFAPVEKKRSMDFAQVVPIQSSFSTSYYPLIQLDRDVDNVSNTTQQLRSQSLRSQPFRSQHLGV